MLERCWAQTTYKSCTSSRIAPSRRERPASGKFRKPSKIGPKFYKSNKSGLAQSLLQLAPQRLHHSATGTNAQDEALRSFLGGKTNRVGRQSPQGALPRQSRPTSNPQNFYIFSSNLTPP